MSRRMHASARVDIVLSTHNGDRYLDEQIRSVLAQSVDDWALLVRDDGSRDNTVARLRQHAASDGQRIRIVEAGEQIGPAASYGRLCQQTTAPYVMLCDQDDVWSPGKIADSLAAIRRTEGSSPAIPALVFSDLTVVDPELETIAESFWQYAGLGPRGASLACLLWRNCAAGCSMIMNRALLDEALPIPDAAVMHDYWLLVVAALKGNVGFLEQPTALYRQHAGNAIGAAPGPHDPFELRLRRVVSTFVRRRRWYRAHSTHIRQAEALLERFQESMPANRRRIVEAFLEMDRCGYWGRKYRQVRFGFLPFGWYGNLKWLLLG